MQRNQRQHPTLTGRCLHTVPLPCPWAGTPLSTSNAGGLLQLEQEAHPRTQSHPHGPELCNKVCLLQLGWSDGRQQVRICKAATAAEQCQVVLQLAEGLISADLLEPQMCPKQDVSLEHAQRQAKCSSAMTCSCKGSKE